MYPVCTMRDEDIDNGKAMLIEIVKMLTVMRA